MSASTTQNIRPVPAPWTLKGTIYYFMIPITEKDAVTLSSEKDFLYSPLEANSSFANHELVGGSATVQVVRYSESPVGPYGKSTEAHCHVQRRMFDIADNLEYLLLQHKD